MVVAVCCIGIVASMFACLLDLCGTLNRCLKVVKDYSFGNVITGKLVFVNISFKNAVYIDMDNVSIDFKHVNVIVEATHWGRLPTLLGQDLGQGN